MGLDLNEIAGGGKSWTPELGEKISGIIVNVKRVQQTAFNDPSTKLTWDDGSPRMQTVVDLQTDLRADDDDDGVRSIWLKGGKNFEPAEGSGASGEVALADAAKQAGAKSIDEGATLQVACTGLAKATTRGFQPAKLYTMKYTPKVASIATDDLFDD